MPEKPSKLLPALYGGLIMGAISGLPVVSIVNCFCCAGILLGGFLSVMFYRNELTPTMSPLTNSDCLQLGVFAGLFGAVVGTVFSLLALATVGNISGEAVLNILRNIIPPEAMEKAEQSMEESSRLTIFAGLKTFGINIVFDPLFGMLGGLIGFNVYKSKGPTMNTQPPSASATPAP